MTSWWRYGSVFLLSLLTFLAFRFEYRAHIILSGSMEPALSRGSLVVTHTSYQPYSVGSVVTYHWQADGRATVTHRITSRICNEGACTYTTKGDANTNGDLGVVSQNQVVGKVVLAIPYLGYSLVGVGAIVQGVVSAVSK